VVKEFRVFSEARRLIIVFTTARHAGTISSMSWKRYIAKSVKGIYSTLSNSGPFAIYVHDNHHPTCIGEQLELQNTHFILFHATDNIYRLEIALPALHILAVEISLVMTSGFKLTICNFQQIENKLFRREMNK
jgi:hypothetical protein